MEKHLHIVCFDVPYPLNYGGVFDPFCMIQTMHEMGIHLHLHCFEYGRGQQLELEKYCVEVNYYPRNQGHKGFSTEIPYIVSSRSSKTLLENLQQDRYPVLLEGIHCTYPLYAGALENRRVILRLHNVEYKYYHHLFHHEKSWLKKAYFYNESRLLKQYERKLANQATILAMSEKDVDLYKQKFQARSISYLPVFTPFQQVTSMEGLGTYCLYHGNLSVAENEKAAIWLLENVFDKLDLPFVIAGKNPSARLQRIAELNVQSCVIENPDDQEMKDLIRRAQINILPSFNDTGIKLKLLNALYNGRHCIVNEAAIHQTGLEPACHIGTNAEAFQHIIVQLYNHAFGEEEITLRTKLLGARFSNRKNCKQLIELIW
ncbi:MAG: glycosyltransferase [Williamsia sp.]|nr:glycosyltransferase [Williamsia sp.]